MIYTRLISGLGNQLFQYAVARQLAVINNTPLKLDVSFYRSQNLRSFKLDRYNINAGLATDEEINKFFHVLRSNSFYARMYRRFERMQPRHKKRYFKEAEPWQYEPDLYRAGNPIYIEGYWQHQQYFKNMGLWLNNELTLKDQHELDGYPIFNQLKHDDGSVAIHIRRGDYIKDPDAFNLFGVLPMDYYLKAINHMNINVKSPRYYIFSDDLDWVKDNLKINNPVTYVDIANGSKDYLELDAMSKCRHQIIANSSFSWWGAYLNRHAGKIVVAPGNWVKPQHINQKIDIQLPSWIKLT